MKYVFAIVSAGILTSCSLVPFLGGKLAHDAEVVGSAAIQGAEAGLEADIHG